MPTAAEKLVQAIEKVNTELLKLKCDLKLGDKVIIAPIAGMYGCYLLTDKMI